MTKSRWLLLAAVVLVGIFAYFVWRSFQPTALPEGFTSGNGRIEAVEIDIAAKIPGRITEILVNEGDFVVAGQALAKLDTAALDAQFKEAEADLRRNNRAVETARSNVRQRQSEKAAAESLVAQREAEFDATAKTRNRIEDAAKQGVASNEDLDNARAKFFSAEAAVKAAKANVAAGDASISAAESLVIEAEASVAAAKSRIDRLRADIDDCILRAPRDGRVQYRVSQPGEVLNAGGKVLNMVDLSDVYMTFFLPTAAAGRVQIGAEVHLVLDAAPHLVIPARVTFVADVAQFTPKTVETAIERQKLMFRIKAHIDPELLKKHIRSVKTGLPGMAYVQLNPQAEWPANLQTRLPQ